MASFDTNPDFDAAADGARRPATFLTSPPSPLPAAAPRRPPLARAGPHLPRAPVDHGLPPPPRAPAVTNVHALPSSPLRPRSAGPLSRPCAAGALQCLAWWAGGLLLMSALPRQNATHLQVLHFDTFSLLLISDTTAAVFRGMRINILFTVLVSLSYHPDYTGVVY